MRLNLVVILTLLSSCTALKPKPETPVTVLGNAGVVNLTVTFLGDSYTPDDLFVCGTLKGEFSCVPWVVFQTQIAGQH